jgi:hypothetical protein
MNNRPSYPDELFDQVLEDERADMLQRVARARER